MARTSNPIPTYRLHKRTGRAIITVRDQTGARRDILLPGAFDSAESRHAYDEQLALIRTNKGRLPSPEVTGGDLTVTELLLRYMSEHVEGYYIDTQTGEPSREQRNIRDALKPLNRLFGSTPAARFSPSQFRLLRDACISGTWLNDEERERRQKLGKRLDMARQTVNSYMKRVKMLFRWAVEMEIVPAATLTGIAAVKSLQQGRTTARETREVMPVEKAIVDATLLHLPPMVADMVRLQLLTGARPGEICAMRVRDLEMTGDVWVYKPVKHKTAWRGHKRNVALGPRAQAIVRKYLKPQLDAYLFSPAEADRQRKEEMRKNRKTPVQPSQIDRAKKDAKRKPGARYRVTAYNCAIRRACRRANVPHWHPHQLRHSASLLIERECGLEAARATLGHRSVNQTVHYSGLDLERAQQVAAKIG